MRPRRALPLLALAIGLLSWIALVSPSAWADTRDPYLAIATGNFADPAIIQAGKVYYAYSTNDIPAHKNVPVASASTPMGPWTVRPDDALPTLGAWARQRVGLTWAPDVTRLADGTYLMYYTARDRATHRQCIGAAESAGPLGPFVPVGDAPLVCDAGEGGDIDPAAFTDLDGTRYLTYKNDGNAIGQPTWLYVQQVAGDGVTPIGDPVRTIRNDAAEGVLIEAPYLVHRPGMGYVMLYSYGSWTNASYTESYATAPSLAGPWTKAGTPLMTTQGFGGRVTGPGGASVLLQPGVDYIVFHGVFHEPKLHRCLYVAHLRWIAGPGGVEIPVVQGMHYPHVGSAGDPHAG